MKKANGALLPIRAPEPRLKAVSARAKPAITIKTGDHKYSFIVYGIFRNNLTDTPTIKDQGLLQH